MTISKPLRCAAALLVSASAMAFAGTAHADATLSIGHEANPDDVQDFTYTVDLLTQGGAQLGMMLDDDAGASGGNAVLAKDKTLMIPPGDIQITQSNPGAGWTLDAINCSGSGSVSPNIAQRRVTLNVADGAMVTCKFINSRVSVPPPTAEIRIFKDAMPNSLADFGFTGSGPNFAQAFILDDDAGVPNASTQRQNNKAFIVPPGQPYVFTEPQVNGWVLTGITCSPNGSAAVDLSGRKVTVTPLAGQTVTCTFRNKPTPPLPCLGNYPMNAVVNLFATGWETVNICRGGTVTFNKGPGISVVVTPSTPPGSFTPISMGVGAGTGTTGPFPNTGTTPITYKYWAAASYPQGSIIVW